ncbi:MAG TPA: DUF6428 family protein [Candidatus Sphingobacterium stercoripullorum]|nr:DUF6428 family protein [Candidatus Sphingobacterium stercoripullorum]
MKLSEFKEVIQGLDTLEFVKQDGTVVPAHFHLTELGIVKKDFIDCGGKLRNEVYVNLQLWHATDYEHRLTPEKLSQIIKTSSKELAIDDAELEIEYQGETIGKYGLDFNGHSFVLVNKQTNCLAPDACGTAEIENVEGIKPKLVITQTSGNTCEPGSGCC